MLIKVLVVDDSALIRKILREIINHQPDMEVVGCAQDAWVARTLIKSLKPDVLTLDVEMPKMNGLEFLDKLMRLRPMPVVMISALTRKSSSVTLQALNLGAVDFIAKPQLGPMDKMHDYAQMIAEKIRIAAKAKIKPVSMALMTPSPFPNNQVFSTKKLIAIGASTGGTVAINLLLQEMPVTAPGIVITQHMPPGFTASFAARLNNDCKITVQEAENNMRIRPGHAYIAPGGYHLMVCKQQDGYYTKLSRHAAVNRHRPSVDVLFDSVAQSAGKHATGIILTGMGADGAMGLLKMKQAGAFNFAQNEKSCVVYGMPQKALKLGAIDQILSVEQITNAVLRYLIRSS